VGEILEAVEAAVGPWRKDPAVTPGQRPGDPRRQQVAATMERKLADRPSRCQNRPAWRQDNGFGIARLQAGAMGSPAIR